MNLYFNPQLIGKMNGTLALKEGVPLGDAMGELVDSETLAFEDKLIEMLLEESDELAMDGGGNGLNLYVNVERSFMDIASGSINKVWSLTQFYSVEGSV